MFRRGGLAWGTVLATNKGITSLDLQKNGIGDNACSHIIAALKTNPFLRTLNLADNRLGIKSSVQLREVFDENVTLTNLDISWNHIRPQDLCVLSQTLTTNKVLKTLSIAWNGIGDKITEQSAHADSMESLAQTQKTATSKASSPRRPVTGPDAGDSLVNVIQNNEGITELDISSCRLGSHLCKDLARALASNRR